MSILVVISVAAGCERREQGEAVVVAVASNFVETAEILARNFTSATGHPVVFIRGSSGKLYAQIRNGAPIDVFLSADAERPRQLQSPTSGRSFVYALGRLVVWSGDPHIRDNDCQAALGTTRRKVAIANPRVAPYGAAAQQYLQRLSLWDRLQTQLVFGENVSQALQFAATGNASLAIVARSQLALQQLPEATCVGDVPVNLHAPIEQAAIITEHGATNAAAHAFAAFLQGASARATIRSRGYRMPGANPGKDEYDE